MTPAMMPYTRDTSRLDVDLSAFVFPGDEKVTSTVYLTTMTNTYLRKVPLAGALMQQFRIPFGDEDYERMKRLMVAMGWLDHLLDEAPDRSVALKVYQDLVESLKSLEPLMGTPTWVRPELLDSTILLCNAIKLLPAENIQTIIEKALSIGDISVKKAVCDGVRQYAAILTQEGSLTSDLSLECLGVAARNSDGFTKLYLWNEKAMAAATLFDAAIDLKQDYQESLIKLRPSVWYQIYLFCQAFAHIPIVMRGLGLRGIKTLAKVGVN